MGPTGCPETSVPNYHSTLRNIPDECIFQQSHFYKPKGPQVLKKFTAVYGTPKFVTAFTTARHLSIVQERLVNLHVLRANSNSIHRTKNEYACAQLYV